MDDLPTTEHGSPHGGDTGTGDLDHAGTVTGPVGSDTGPAGQPGNIGDALGHDLGNVGSGVPAGSDRTFPEPQVSDKTF